MGEAAEKLQATEEVPFGGVPKLGAPSKGSLGG